MKVINGETIDCDHYVGIPLTYTRFVNCRFTGREFPRTANCEFSDCQMQGLKFRELVTCKLWNCNISGSDFTEADVRWTQTEPAAKTIARNCVWPGVIAVNDCRFWAGLEVASGDAYILSMLGLLVSGPDRDQIYRSIPDSVRYRVASLLRRPFRS